MHFWNSGENTVTFSYFSLNMQQQKITMQMWYYAGTIGWPQVSEITIISFYYFGLKHLKMSRVEMVIGRHVLLGSWWEGRICILQCLRDGSNPVPSPYLLGMCDQSQNKVARTGEPEYPIGSVSIWHWFGIWNIEAFHLQGVLGVGEGSCMTQEVIWIKNKSKNESQLQSLKMNFQEGWGKRLKKYYDFCHDRV